MQRVLSWWRGKDHGAPSPGDNSPEIKLHINLPYMMVETQDHVVIDKQCCNIYQPVGGEEGKKYPVIVFVHGGSWRRGDRAHRWFDVYGQNAKILAQAVSFRVLL
jgi:acetyl esterase/lipase